SRPLISRLLRHRKLAKRLTRGRRKTNCWRIKFSNSGIEDYRTHAHDDPWPLLERKPDRDSDIAWTATTYIRVLSAHIGSHRKRQVPLTPPGRVQPVARPIHDDVRGQGIRELDMVE